MNGRNAKALRKVFNAKEDPGNYRDFKRALRKADPRARKVALQRARDVVKSGKPIKHMEVKNVGN